MLVLSRRQNDKVVFPHLGISVEILRIKGNSVRVGIDAPPEIDVVRHEIAEAEGNPLSKPPWRTFNHQVRNRLNTANLALHLAQKQLEAGLGGAAERTLQKALGEFRSLDQEIADGRFPAKPDRPTRALLVEDDRNESELLAAFLRASGFEVDTADDGGEALDYLGSHLSPDVVLLDMQMPKLDGPSTITAIRSNPQFAGLKVFAVSGSEPSEVGVSTGPEGVDRWFSKPIDPQTLVRQMNRELEALPTPA